MLSWLPLAQLVLPEIVKALAGDKAGEIAKQVTNAVKETTGAKTPDEAKAKVEKSPEVETELKLKLAQIAAEADENKREAELETLKQQLADQDKARQAQLERIKASVEDMKSARGSFQALATSGSRFAWGAPGVSIIVSIGFFVILGLLLSGNFPEPEDSSFQILNILLGTLATAFTTVVAFWLGNNENSRVKDDATFRLISQQAQQTADVVKAQTDTAIQIVKQAGTGTQGTDEQKESNHFQRCLDVILKWEGGYGNHPQDPGGPTNFGITLATLQDWRGKDKKVTADDVKNLEIKEVREIYRTNYWNKLRCDELPAGIDLVVFDFGVNAGVGRSARVLQEVVGAAADGSVGPATIAATKAQDAKRVVQEFSDRRLELYKSFKGWGTFGKGWTNRTNDVLQIAMKMVGT